MSEKAKDGEGMQPVAWMTHHEQPMLFPTRQEAASYCAEDEEPEPLYALPEGYVIVPREPTARMCEAGTVFDSTDELSDIGANVVGIWEAMIAASEAK